MIKKAVIFIMTLACLFCLAGCKVPYNAEIVSDSYNYSGEWLNENFVKNNYTAWSNHEGVLIDGSFPKSRTFVIKSEEEKCKILNGYFDVEVNFEREMLIIYTWTTDYRRPCYIKSLELKDEILCINFYVKSSPPLTGGSCMSYQRWFVIKLDLLSTSSVEIKEL